MTNGHLDDGQIQEILDNMVFQPGQSLASHLETCPSCWERFEQYRQLYAGLAVDPGFALPPTFADSIIKKLPVSRPVFWARPAVKIILLISACAAAMTGLLIFVNMRPLANETLQIFATLKTAFLTLSGQMKQLFVWLGGNAKPFILGGLGLFSAFIFDRILLRQIVRHSH